MCWLKSLLGSCHSLKIIRMCECLICHVFNFFLFFFFTAVPKVFQYGLKKQSVQLMKSPKCALFCVVSMHFVFPLLVFFVLLLASTLHTEPLLVLGRGRDHPNTWPEERRTKSVSEWRKEGSWRDIKGLHSKTYIVKVDISFPHKYIF